MVDLRVIHRDGRFSLRTLDLVKVTTLNMSQTGLPYDGDNAWSVRFGLENQNLADDRNLTVLVEGGYGKAWQIDEEIALFAFGQARATGLDREHSYLQGGAKIGALIGETLPLKTRVEIGVW